MTKIQEDILLYNGYIYLCKHFSLVVDTHPTKNQTQMFTCSRGSRYVSQNTIISCLLLCLPKQTFCTVVWSLSRISHSSHTLRHSCVTTGNRLPVPGTVLVPGITNLRAKLPQTRTGEGTPSSLSSVYSKQKLHFILL
jgi:hypothetical protein